MATAVLQEDTDKVLVAVIVTVVDVVEVLGAASPKR